jgi:uncharacterized protein (DUF4415 family)
MKAKHAPGYVPNSHYSQEDWDEVSDNPEWTDEELANARPAREVLPPAFFEALARKRGQRGLQKAPTKVAISIRLSKDVIDAFKADGPGWQARMDEALRAVVRRRA